MDALTFFESVHGDDSACAVTHDLRMIAVSPGWTRFAHTNGGREVLERWGPGAALTSAIPEPLLTYCREVFERVRATHSPWDCDYGDRGPVYVANRPGKLSHGMCPSCAAHH